MMPRLAAAFAAPLLVACLAAGCSSADEIDGVLWRQMDAVKQPVFAAFSETREMDRAALVNDIVTDGGAFPGHYYERVSGLEAGDRSGGVFLSRLDEGADWVSLNVLLSSGARNLAGDALARADPYSGPSSVYTCFLAIAEFADDRVVDWAWDEEAECDPAIVAALDEEAQFMPLYQFSG